MRDLGGNDDPGRLNDSDPGRLRARIDLDPVRAQPIRQAALSE